MRPKCTAFFIASMRSGGVAAWNGVAITPGAIAFTRMPRLAKSREFLVMYLFVREKGYERGSFADWGKKA